jgi:hypothetical protein
MQLCANILSICSQLKYDTKQILPFTVTCNIRRGAVRRGKWDNVLHNSDELKNEFLHSTLQHIKNSVSNLTKKRQCLYYKDHPVNVVRYFIFF